MLPKAAFMQHFMIEQILDDLPVDLWRGEHAVDLDVVNRSVLKIPLMALTVPFPDDLAAPSDTPDLLSAQPRVFPDYLVQQLIEIVIVWYDIQFFTAA